MYICDKFIFRDTKYTLVFVARTRNVKFYLRPKIMQICLHRIPVEMRIHDSSIKLFRLEDFYSPDEWLIRTTRNQWYRTN